MTRILAIFAIPKFLTIPNFPASSPLSSAKIGNGKPSFSENFWCEATSSKLTPKTTAFDFIN